jgi:hypothetical protein
MEIEFQLSKKDYINFQRENLKNFFFRRKLILVLITICIFFPLTGDGHVLSRDLMAFIVSPLIVFVVFFLTPYTIFLLRLNKSLPKNGSSLNKTKISVLDEGLFIESKGNSSTKNWASIKSAQLLDNFIYLIFIDKRWVPIPKRAFPSESEWINFGGSLQKNSYFPTKLTQRSIFTPYNKPPYKKGLICLIPIVGAVFGVMFIADGFGKYSDKRFVLIGLGGIVFNACIALSIFYYFDLGAKFNAGFVPLSQSQLNSVMREVEFFKLKNGVYPDSLEQLKIDAFNTSIYDPLKEGGEVNKNQEYNYKKVGNHYYLFSSGLDGIANTKDDFYPQVAKSDRGKFGLIIKKY